MKILLTLLLIIFLPLPLLAQDSSQFLVSVVGGEDNNPPTAPVLLSADPVAATQIDLTWSASTDDVILSGYVVLRDGLPIATTTLTSYSDTGLNPETLYTYETYAFDGFNNISSTSNQIATTTPALPVVPVATSTEANPTATLVFRLLGFDLTEDTTAVKINWRTSKPAKYELRWGRGDSYETGYVISDVYKSQQNTVINQLEPGTTYQYELVGYSAGGEVLVLKKGEFKTKSIESTVVSNVLGFYGKPALDDVLLEWMLPDSFSGRVRIVRSHLGYPSDIYDGAIVFDGVGNTVRDSGVLKNYDEVFYTAFIIMPDGSISSGAVTKVSVKEGVIEDESGEGGVIEVPDLVAPTEWQFSRDLISLVQLNVSYSFATDSKPVFDYSAPVLVRIPFGSVPNNLKSIIVTLLDPANNQTRYSFLLRLNKDGDYYEAVIPPVLKSGKSLMTLEIYDYERMVVGRYTKKIEFIKPDTTNVEVIFPDKIVNTLRDYLPYAGAAVLVLVIFLVLWRLRDEDND
jgi:hypothetical protein